MVIIHNSTNYGGASVNIIIIFIVISIIIFFPIPINCKLHYYNNNLHSYIYGKEISFRKRVTKNIKHDVRSKDYIGIIKKYYFKAKDIKFKLENSRLKPKLNFIFYMEYGTEDAAKTAIYFGILNSCSPFLYSFINKFFRIKKYSFCVAPNFKASKIDLILKSIVKISIVNTIYIAILILLIFLEDKRLKKLKLLHAKEEL